MFEHKSIQRLDDFFLTLDKRRERSVFFYRISGYNKDVDDFILKYYNTALKNGTVIENGIPNPTGDNLLFFSDMMGHQFFLDKDFIERAMARWLPRMKVMARGDMSAAIYRALSSLKNMGKNDNVVKNAYIKFMCWLYYRFESVVNRLGDNDVPKILYEGSIGRYELLLVSILCGAGCDVVLLLNHGEEEYRSIDTRGTLSNKLELPDMKPFPSGYGIEYIREKQKKADVLKRLYGEPPVIRNCTNAWLEGNILEDIKKPPVTRGKDTNLFYNAFCRITGAEDKVTYENELYQFYLEIKNGGRTFCIVNKEIPVPTAEETARINKRNYTTKEEMIRDLIGKVRCPFDIQLERLIRTAFVDIVTEISEAQDMNLNKLTSKAVYILCWLLRYFDILFNNWHMPFVSLFIYLGGCRNDNEAYFLRFLARLPCDVLILVPNLNTRCVLADKVLFEQKNQQSLNIESFPTESSGIRMATAAYHAERELDEIMYSNSGMYRNFQYSKANAVTLRTMYEEIAILWDQEMRYRPNFSTVDNIVNMPVIFAKVSGVKDGDVSKYWQGIRQLINEDTLVISSAPYIDYSVRNALGINTTECFKNGKVQKNTIYNSRYYQYSMLRPETQEYILDKLQILIDSRIIVGTFADGTEYNIVSQILNMPTEVVRLIQKFDFTKRNPKVIYINTSERPISPADATLMAFLNVVGFDVLFFVPTGYQTIERFYTRPVVDEHQIGEYMYDMQIPNLGVPSGATGKPAKQTWIKKFFKKGK